MFPHRSCADRAGGSAQRSTRYFLLICALVLAMLAVLAAVIPTLVDAPPSTAGALSWRPTALGALVVVGALCHRRFGAWLALALGIGVVEIPVLLADSAALRALASSAQSLLVGLLLAFVSTALLALARTADRAAADRRRAVSAAAAAAGAHVARARAAALVHDEVLSTLGLAASAVPVDATRLGAQAARARTLLAAEGDERGSGSALASLRAEITELDPNAAFSVHGDQDDVPPHLPTETLSVVRDATLEALRNSVRHAGRAARRAVAITHGNGEIAVRVSDDGVGFDPAQVQAHRLGLRTATRAARAIGGSVDVHSATDRGTEVSIRWPALSASTSDADEKSALPTAAQHGGTGLARVGVAVTASAFALTQTLLAIVAAPDASHPFLPGVILVLLLGTAAPLVFRHTRAPGPADTVIALTGVGAATILGIGFLPFAVGHLWYAAAAAYLLAALALRGQPRIAAIAALALSAVLTVSGGVQGAPPLLFVSVAIRPLGVTLFAVGLSVAITRLLARITRDIATTHTVSARRAWERSARTERATRTDEVRTLVDDLLAEIAAGTSGAAVSARARAVEGQLRDRIRAGRLATEPLLSAASTARARGVDVLLLDDRDGAVPQATELDAAIAHAAAACAEATESVTVRILPPDRSMILSLVIDGEPRALPRNH